MWFLLLEKFFPELEINNNDWHVKINRLDPKMTFNEKTRNEINI